MSVRVVSRRVVPGTIALVGLLAACVPSPNTPLRGERAEARAVAERLVAARDPVIEPGPVAQCAAASATGDEAAALLAADRAGDAVAAQAALEVMLRKTTTQACLAEAGSPDFL
ncbi:hypothetical protein DLJ49_11505 [Rhodovulum sp. 12E13]|uniref:hypothetical protein n=1 Tax=Rhodovulum sp. 12E13 TaxID=2203891 RepID=UPI000E186F5C|nr:hypothetical protein [Rhodovulum sp. 12E13]RDC72255.1 hypothetical protein DLJ49_11505 [Rhodovulum sp. 12E13]